MTAADICTKQLEVLDKQENVEVGEWFVLVFFLFGLLFFNEPQIFFFFGTHMINDTMTSKHIWNFLFSKTAVSLI